jgi:hypothetical protein
LRKPFAAAVASRPPAVAVVATAQAHLLPLPPWPLQAVIAQQEAMESPSPMSIHAWRVDMAWRSVPAISVRGPRSVYVNSSIQT